MEIAPKCYSLMQWTKTLLWVKRVSKHKAPIAARCTLMVAMAVYKLKCNQTNVLTVQQNAHTNVNQFLVNSYFIHCRTVSPSYHRKGMNFYYYKIICDQR